MSSQGGRLSREVARGRPAARLTRPLREFLETETAGGIVLLAAVAVALVWANSPLSSWYRTLWETEFSFQLGDWHLGEDLRHWVNDGLMVIFFFVVGLEIKRELVRGELNSARKALLPTVAALGGMVVPALLYVTLNVGGEAFSGWGVPMATDIALAIGVLALLGPRLPTQLRVILLSVAIVDDIGAILVIAVFYTEEIVLPALGSAAGLLLLVVAMRRLRVWWVPAYVVVGAGVWLATLLSGIHATIAGVALGLLAPARPLRQEPADEPPGPSREEEGPIHPAAAREAKFRAATRTPVTERLEHLLHPWTSFLILPLFALANAGVPLRGEDLARSATSTITLGVILGLVVGKTVGIAGSAWLATRLGARLPRAISWGQMIGLAALGGIGFTMSLFIGNLAFTQAEVIEEAKVGILFGSTVAAGLGALILFRSGHPPEQAVSEGAEASER